MKLIQFYDSKAGLRVGFLAKGEVVDITSPQATDSVMLLSRATTSSKTVAQVVNEVEGVRPGLRFDDLAKAHAAGAQLLIPIHAPEVWGFGVTYRTVARARTSLASGDDLNHGDFYQRAFANERPEIFFKATPSRCVGPGLPIHIRSDSSMTVAEPELGLVIDEHARVLAYTICNDVSAWDIEAANPLYLTQSKTFLGCCAIGPVLLTTDEVVQPYDLHVVCRVLRGPDRKVACEDQANTALLNRRFDEMLEFLCRDNPIPTGTVVSTGTGTERLATFPLEDGDVVEIEIDGIGCLINPVKKLPA